MSSSSLRTIDGLSEPRHERLYYGYSTVTGLVRTPLQIYADISSALSKEDGYEEGKIDELVMYATEHWRPTADVSWRNVDLAQKAIAAFSRGYDIDLQSKIALTDFREFAGDCVFEGQTSYPQSGSNFILTTIDRTGLTGELLERYEEEREGLSIFMSENVRWPSYSEEASKAIHGQDTKLASEDMEQMEERRIVAAAEFVTSMSLAVGALYAASSEGKVLEGLVAERLNPLLGI